MISNAVHNVFQCYPAQVTLVEMVVHAQTTRGAKATCVIVNRLSPEPTVKHVIVVQFLFKKSVEASLAKYKSISLYHLTPLLANHSPSFCGNNAHVLYCPFILPVHKGLYFD